MQWVHGIMQICAHSPKLGAAFATGAQLRQAARWQGWNRRRSVCYGRLLFHL